MSKDSTWMSKVVGKMCKQGNFDSKMVVFWLLLFYYARESA